MIESHRKDHGFTLIEVLIVVILMGVLMSSLAAVFSVIVRTAPSAENRADNAVSLLSLTTWLPPDVNSTPAVAIASAAANWNTAVVAPSGCSSGDIGNNLVVLKWSEQTGSSPTSYTANYRLGDDGAGGSTMWRISCTNGGFGNVRQLVRDLPPLSTDPVTVTIRDETDDLGATTVVGLSMSVTTVSGDVLRFDAQSNNPDDVLEAIPTPGTVAATTTTSTTTAPTTTTTIVAGGPTTTTTTTTSTTTTTTTIPCTADFITGSGSNRPVSPSKVRNQQGQNQVFGPLEEDVYVKITKSGSCAGLRLEFIRAPGSDTATDREPVRLSFGDSSEAILRGEIPTERWEDGNRELRLFDTGNETFLGRTEYVEVQ
jgi:prepilin-type N-terminal cleavage/methylation domain-containing protein